MSLSPALLRTTSGFLKARIAAAPLCSRALSTSSPRFFTPNRPRLLASTSDPGSVGKVETQVGSEGFHYKDDPISTPRVPEEVEKGRPIGDWVLFHPVYSEEELKCIKVVQRPRETIGDKAAGGAVKLARKMFDVISGYKDYKLTEEDKKLSLEELRRRKLVLGPSEWLMRILFLESIAGVPGMVAATVRHLRSLRLMRRDGGWIHTLLEEAENERMHLMTFMTLKKPSIFFRAIILGAQGVFYNLFFLGYIIRPSICHRFVGCLEEEAVRTYTHCIAEIEAGRLPEWSSRPAPAIAIDYWRLQPNATMLDVVYAVRSDESTHRFVNHTFANLTQEDGNPFAVREPDMTVKGVKPGFTRAESEDYAHEGKVIQEEVQQKVDEVKQAIVQNK